MVVGREGLKSRAIYAKVSEGYQQHIDYFPSCSDSVQNEPSSESRRMFSHLQAATNTGAFVHRDGLVLAIVGHGELNTEQ